MLTQERLEYLTAEQAAARVGVSLSTVRRALARGEVTYAIRSGQRKLLLADEVDRWAKKRGEL